MLDLPPLSLMIENTTLQRLLKRAERQIERKCYERAIASLRRAILYGADEYTCTLHIAALYSMERRWEWAFGAVERAIALAPRRPVAHELLMNVAMEAGDPDRALSASQTLIKLLPRHIPAYDALGAIYMQRGDINAALRVTNALIRLAPHDASHRFKKALLCQHKGEVALAVQEFAATIQIDPEGTHAEAAREALENLDALQINQVLTLAMEDMLFRAKLARNAPEAAEERGFTLSGIGKQILKDLCAQLLTETPDCCRTTRYN